MEVHAHELSSTTDENYERYNTITRTFRTTYVYPLKPHFYIAKLGYAGAALFFLFLLQNINCGYSLEPPSRGGSNENRLCEAVLTCTHNLCFEQKEEKYQKHSAENFHFLKHKKSLFIAWACFCNASLMSLSLFFLNLIFQTSSILL